MKKDFATKNKKRGHATRFKDNETDNNVLVTMVLGVVLGIGITLAAIYYYNQPSEAEVAVVEETKPVEKPSAKNRYQAVPADEVEPSEFSFHEELENKNIEVEAEALEQVPATTDKTWIMQCGSFRERSMAETLRAKIAFNGYEPRIRSTVNEQGNTWHRVQLGPYKSKRNAGRIRNQLRSNGIEGCAIW